MIAVEDVTKTYRGMTDPALRGISFTLQEGEWAYLVGPSGAGKSTLLKLLYKAIRPDRGRIRVGGRDLAETPDHEIRRRMGIMFQSFYLLPTKTALENVAFGAEVQGAPPAEARRRAGELLERVGLADKLHRFPGELSGGEQQRVGIARALVNHPRIIIGDEPTGDLDPETAVRMFDLLHALHREWQATVLMATHAADLVDRRPARVMRLEQGRIVADEAASGYIHGVRSR